MRLLATLPLSVVRALGKLLGWLLYALVGSRRRVVTANLSACFPDKSTREIGRLTRQTFVYFAQAWLDRSWVWHAPRSWILRRVTLTGAVHEMTGQQPTIVFVPHFVGMDAAWGGLVLRHPRESATIYTDQSNKLIDRWILRGRRRWGHMQLFGRIEGVKPVVQAVRLGRAKVVPGIVTMTPTGYEVKLLPAWQNFPSDDVVADTAFMNKQLEGYILDQPAQYFWVHKRFKTRPEGEPEFY